MGLQRLFCLQLRHFEMSLFNGPALSTSSKSQYERWAYIQKMISCALQVISVICTCFRTVPIFPVHLIPMHLNFSFKI